MPRPVGWKPLSYTMIAHICGRIIRGDQPVEIARDHRITKACLHKIKASLAATGVVVPSFLRMPSTEQKAAVTRLLQTTRMTNQEIRRAVGLTSTCMPRKRRFAYYRELEKEGKPVPRCECGDVFEHSHLCLFRGTRGTGRREGALDDADIRQILQDFRDGLRHIEIMERNSIGPYVLQRVKKRMTTRDRLQRKRNFVSQSRQEELRRQARAAGDSLFRRIGACLTGVDATIRDDVHQLIMVTLYDGRLAEEDAIRRKREFVTKAYAQADDRWQTTPLDGMGDELSLSERLADDAALAAFDEVELAAAGTAEG